MHDIPPKNAVMRQPNRSTNDPVKGPRENMKANPTEPTQAGREQNSLNHCAVTVSWGISQTCITVNPLLSPLGGLFFSSTFEGGLKERGDLFNLAKRITYSKNTGV